MVTFRTPNMRVLAMELSDFDLDQFVKDKPFGENHVKTFFYQMSKSLVASHDALLTHMASHDAII